jgi:Right handed beta helix region
LANVDGHVFLQSIALPTVIRNNGGDGLAFLQGSTGRVDGQNTIENNGALGVRVDSSTVTFFGDSTGSTTITGHRFGVGVSSGGELTFAGPHQITGNGTLTNEGGIHVERSSLNLLNGATVSGNTGTGILGDAHSGIVLGPGASVTNNSSTGIRLRHQSLVSLTAPVTIQGNGGVNIACGFHVSGVRSACRYHRCSVPGMNSVPTLSTT